MGYLNQKTIIVHKIKTCSSLNRLQKISDCKWSSNSYSNKEYSHIKKTTLPNSGHRKSKVESEITHSWPSSYSLYKAQKIEIALRNFDFMCELKLILPQHHFRKDYCCSIDSSKWNMNS